MEVSTEVKMNTWLVYSLLLLLEGGKLRLLVQGY